jgi:hypothetical protein
MDIRYGRKRRGIVHELNKKLSDWLDSIDDEELRNVVAKDTIVTGGAIASMLLGERVNDFDVYFRTKSTARSVAEYYVKKFNEIKPSSDYAPEVREETRKNAKGEMEDRVIIWLQSAGVASEEQSGYAYFETLDESATAEFVESLVEKDDEPATQPYRSVFLSENAITLSDKVQLVTRFYGEPDKIHDNYDFVHATCYYDYGTRELVLPAEALECLLSRTLVYRGSLYPVASIFRMKKFLDRGWRITAGQQLKIMWQISELDLRDYSVLREQLTGVDMAYMWQLIEALHNTDPEKISSTYVSEIIDRIFG